MMHLGKQPQQIKLTKFNVNRCFDSAPESFFYQSTIEKKQEASIAHSAADESFSIKWNNLNYMTEKSVLYPKWIFGSSPASDDLGEQKHEILNESFGEIESGKLTTILGPSGCGKTTLIRALFQLNSLKKHNLSGNIFIDGDKANDSMIDSSENVPRLASSYNSTQSLSSSNHHSFGLNSSDSFSFGERKKKLNISIINQKDNLIQCLTVREDLTFVVRLRLCQLKNLHKQSDAEINEKVHRLADNLQLTKCLDVPIRTISGGEQKRLSVAREIVHRPDILVLDEPTTGLDSLSSLKLVKLLKQLVMIDNELNEKLSPMAIVMIVHQPQLELFNLFDRVIVMSKYGQTIYNEQSRNVSDILNEIANLKLPNATYNPASFLVEIGSGESGMKPINKLVSYFKQRLSLMNHQATATIMQKCIKGNKTESKQTIGQLYIDERLLKTATVSDQKSGQRFCCDQLSLLTRRHWLCLTRNTSFCRSRLIFHIVIPLIMWHIFGNVGIPNACPNYQQEIDFMQILGKITNDKNETNSIHSLQLEARATIENLMLLSMMIFALSISTLTHTSTLMPLSINLIRKETQNSLYSLSTYLVAQTIAEFPYETIYPIVSVIILYPLTGQLNFDNNMQSDDSNNSEQLMNLMIYMNLAWRLTISCLTMVLINHLMYSLGLLCGAIFINSIQLAQVFALGTALPYLPLSGYIVRAKHWNIFFRWMSYTSPYKHAITSLMVARYGYNQCSCPLVEMKKNEEKIKVHATIIGVTDQVKRLVSYFMTNRNDELDTDKSLMSNVSNRTSKIVNLNTVDLFDVIADRLSRSQTFGVEVRSCDDLRPFPMTTYKIDDHEMTLGLISLLLMVIVFRLSVYFALRFHLNS